MATTETFSDQFNTALQRLGVRIRLWRARRRDIRRQKEAIRALLDIDDAILADIGVLRAELSPPRRRRLQRTAS